MRERQARRRFAARGQPRWIELERALTDLVETQRRVGRIRAIESMRAVHEERLRRLEQDIIELRGRLMGLIFLAAGTVVTHVIVRLLT